MTPQAEEAFNTLKKKLTLAPVLVFPLKDVKR